MKVLVINAGSSSIKYQLIDMQDETVIAKGLVEKIGLKDSRLVHKAHGTATTINQLLTNHKEGLQLVLETLKDENVGVIKSFDEITAIGHRVLHGGTKFDTATLITDSVMEALDELVPLGPLHMPPNIAGIKACMEVMPNTPNVALFDTAFHATMPEYVYRYALPYEWCEEYGVRRYGFHGMSHQYIAGEAAKVMGKKPEELKLIICHVGNGASVSAVKYGKCFDTSMGLTPLEGLIMGTRSGDFDPAIAEHIMNKTGMSIAEFTNVANKKSGLLGITGVSSDNRDVNEAAAAGNERARLALDMCYYRLKKYIGSYSAALNGPDAIIFTAGIGENSYELREGVMKDMEYLGVEFDFEANRNFKRGEVVCLTKPSSKVKVYIIPTDEELLIARETKKVISNK